MAKSQIAAGLAESEGLVARAVVGHHPLHGDAEAGVVGDRRLQESDGAVLFLVGQDLVEGDAGGVVDADVDVFPADAARLALAGAVAGDPMADLVEPAKLFDVDMDQLAWVFALVAANRLGRFKRGKLVEAKTLEDAADGSRPNGVKRAFLWMFIRSFWP